VAPFDWRRIGDRMRTVYAELAGEQHQMIACSCF
jgi:hypothetical protein